MPNCVDARRWPDSLSGISRAEEGEFLDHVENCPYHERLMRAAEGRVEAAARHAHSLDSGGGAQSLPEQWAVLEELARRYERLEAEPPGKSALSFSLRYRGQEVARYDHFLKFGTCVTRELSGPGDLQLWLLADDDSGADILIGVYLFERRRHHGETLELPLPTGQTLKLSVKHVGGATYDIWLACADAKYFTAGAGSDEAAHSGDGRAEGDADESDDFEALADAVFGHGFPAAPVPPAPSLGFVERATFYGSAAVMLVVILLTLGGVRRASAGGVSPRREPSSRATQNPPPSQAVFSFEDEAGVRDIGWNYEDGPFWAGPAGLVAGLGTRPAEARPAPAAPEPDAADTTPQAATPPEAARAAEGPKGARRRPAGRGTTPRPADAGTPDDDFPGADTAPETTTLTAASHSASAWYYVRAGSRSWAVLVRAGRDAALRDTFVSEWSRASAQPPAADDHSRGAHPDRVVHLYFVWQHRVGTLVAEVKDASGQVLQSFNCQTEAVSLPQARALAVRGLVFELLDYMQGAPQAAQAGGARGQSHAAEPKSLYATVIQMGAAGEGAAMRFPLDGVAARPESAESLCPPATHSNVAALEKK